MPINIVLSDALKDHAEGCPNVDELNTRIAEIEQADSELAGMVSEIQAVIPGTATTSNMLVTESGMQSGLDSVIIDGPVTYQDSLATYDDLLAIQNPERGWWYEVLAPDDRKGFYIWNGTEWKPTSGIISTQDYYKKPEVDALVSAESEALEAEVKKILDDYAAEHGNDKNEWISIFPSTGIAIGSGTFSLDVDLKEVGATEILVLFRMGSVALPQKTASCILPITSEFFPQANYTNYAGHGTTYNGGSVYYKGIITDNPSPGDADTGAAFASFHFPNYKTIQVAIGPFGYLTGVFYRSSKTNAVIQYHKDPTIIVTGNQGTDWSNITGLSLNGTPYLPTTSDGTNVSTGEPYTMPKDGYLYVILTFRNPRLVYTIVEMKINGTRISLWASNNPNETTPDDYRSISAYARVNAGDQLTISVDYRYAGTIPWNGVYNNIYLYGLKDTEVVDDAVAEAFNQHTQNTDIHVTADEKIDIGKVPEAINMIVTLSNEIASLDSTVNDKHIPTDRYRWQDFYATQLELYEQIAASQGLKPDPDNATEIPQGTPYTVAAPQGGLLTVKALNTGGFYTAVAVLGQPSWNSSGLIEDVSVTKYFRLLNGDQVQVDNAQSALFTPAIEDPDNPTRIAMAKMQDEIAANKIMILDIQAGIQNKKPSGVKQDINGQTFTVTNELGGRLTGKGLNLLLGSTGVVTVANAQGTTEVYNNAGLLSLLDPVPVLVKDVAQGDIVTSSGMGELFYEDYISG